MGQHVLGLIEAPANGKDGLPALALCVQDLPGDGLDSAPLIGPCHSLGDDPP